MRKRIWITACPYSGTRYISKLLYAIDLKVGHEKEDVDGMVSWWSLDTQPPVHSIRMHQFRHPLMTIGCMGKFPEHLWDKVSRIATALNFNWSPLETEGLYRCMNFWYWWTVHGLQASEVSYLIEALPFRWRFFLKTVECCDCEMPYIAPTENRGLVERNTVIPSWDELYTTDAELTMEILKIADTIGYTQVPVHYMRDPFYEFPESIHLTLGETPCL